MRITTIFPFSYQEDVATPTLLLWLRRFFGKVTQAINGGLTFGDGVDPDNVFGEWKTIADTGAVDTEFAVAHLAGNVPVGFILMMPPTGGFIYRGGTAWTSTNIYLKCSAANKAIVIFIVYKSQAPDL